MTFRARLLMVFTVTIAVTVAMVVWIVSSSTERAFERLDNERTAALVEQFRKEFAQRGEEVVRAAERIAKADATTRIAIQPDPSLHFNDAAALAAANGLHFLELVAGDGTIVSSAQSPARFGYKETWLTEPVDWKSQPAFLRREELPDEVALALEAVRVAPAGDARLFVIAGRRLDQTLLASLVLPPGMRALLYRDVEPVFSPQALDGVGLAEARRFAPLIEEVRHGNREMTGEIRWGPDAASAETFHAIPLDGRDGRPLGVLLIGSSRRQVAELVRSIHLVGLAVGGAGTLLALLLAGWATARVTRPVKRLAAGARRSGRGKLECPRRGRFARRNRRPGARLQPDDARAGRAARAPGAGRARRRVARTGAAPGARAEESAVPAADHGGEPAARAREHPEQFDEVFRESTATLLAELANLKPSSAASAISPRCRRRSSSRWSSTSWSATSCSCSRRSSRSGRTSGWTLNLDPQLRADPGRSRADDARACRTWC